MTFYQALDKAIEDGSKGIYRECLYIRLSDLLTLDEDYDDYCKSIDPDEDSELYSNMPNFEEWVEKMINFTYVVLTYFRVENDENTNIRVTLSDLRDNDWKTL